MRFFWFIFNSDQYMIFCLKKTTTFFFTYLTSFSFFVFVRKKQVSLLPEKKKTSFFNCLTRFFFFVFLRKKQVCLLLGFKQRKKQQQLSLFVSSFFFFFQNDDNWWQVGRWHGITNLVMTWWLGWVVVTKWSKCWCPPDKTPWPWGVGEQVIMLI